ncbi:MAG: PhzF family phenazine biosynthesis protein [Deltaproteobacteria bacterium]|nr:PhzF family phenazine biosynthesis protein [Deltaproteobacteria bacterium]
MELPLFHVDAFTSRIFGGNPAAVVILKENWLADDLLHAIAAENNLSETAFVITRSQPFPLRWFTPKIEVDLCGHATLASAYVLLKHYFPSYSQVQFATRSGELAVVRQGGQLAMDFPARPGERVPVSNEIIAALGAKPTEAYLARDLLAIFPAEAEVAALKPNLELVAALEAFAVIASAKGDEVDFISRFFAPRAGIPEDPVTGSAHCTLIPYWAGRLGKDVLIARQLSMRGGELTCEFKGGRVLIAGDTVEYLRGEIAV